jgi:hypothetical protein
MIPASPPGCDGRLDILLLGPGHVPDHMTIALDGKIVPAQQPAPAFDGIASRKSTQKQARTPQTSLKATRSTRRFWMLLTA